MNWHLYFIHLLLNMKYILDFVFLYVDILSSVCRLFWFPSFVNPLLDTYLICGRWMFLHCCKWRCGCSRLTVFFEGYWDCGCSSWSRCGMQHLVCVCVCVCPRSCVRAQAYQKALYDIHLIVWFGFTIVFATLKMNHPLMLFLNIQRHLCVASILLHFYIFLSPF